MPRCKVSPDAHPNSQGNENGEKEYEKELTSHKFNIALLAFIPSVLDTFHSSLEGDLRKTITGDQQDLILFNT